MYGMNFKEVVSGSPDGCGHAHYRGYTMVGGAESGNQHGTSL